MENCPNHIETRERLTAAEESTKSAHHRIDALERDVEKFGEYIEAIYQVSNNIENLTKEVEKTNKLIQEQDTRQNEKYEKIDERVTAIEKKPGILATKAWLYVGGLIVAGFIGSFITNMMSK